MERGEDPSVWGLFICSVLALVIEFLPGAPSFCPGGSEPRPLRTELPQPFSAWAAQCQGLLSPHYHSGGLKSKETQVRSRHSLTYTHTHTRYALRHTPHTHRPTLWAQTRISEDLPLLPDFGAQTDTPGHITYTVKAADMQTHQCTHTSMHMYTEARHTHRHPQTSTHMQMESRAREHGHLSAQGPLNADIHTTYTKPPRSVYTHAPSVTAAAHSPRGQRAFKALSPLT